MSATSLSIQAMRSLVGDDFQHMIASTDYDTFILVGAEKPPKEVFEASLQKLIDAQPWKELRQERNQRLAEVDWIFSEDYAIDDESYQQWLAYRKALRDLPAVTENPANPVWPEKPAMPSGTTETKDYTRELQIENNRLKNKVVILENRQTHFNTLLVDVIGRIEKLERPT